MSQTTVQVGDLVTAGYKSGTYIAEVVELVPPKATIKILAVMSHPEQGDLHHPMQTDVPFFHQRKALAYQEKVMVPLAGLVLYQGEVPLYRDSLREALEEKMAALERSGTPWAKRSLEELKQLRADYQL